MNHIGLNKVINLSGLMEMVLELKKWMLGDILLSGLRMRQILMRRLNNLGLVLKMKMIRNLMQLIMSTGIQMLKFQVPILMVYLDNLKPERSLTGKMVMGLRLRSLMLMGTLLLGAKVKKISIKKPNNHGLHLLIREIKLQHHIQWDSLWVKNLQQ